MHRIIKQAYNNAHASGGIFKIPETYSSSPRGFTVVVAFAMLAELRVAGMGCTVKPAGAALLSPFRASDQCGLPPFRGLPAVIILGHHSQGMTGLSQH